MKTYFDHNRSFYVTGVAEGAWVQESGLQAFLFRDASRKCGLTKSQLQQKLRSLPREFWQTLEMYYPEAADLILKMKLNISVDHFGPDDKYSNFASFFLSDTPQRGENLIVLDCRLFAGNYWQALLGHEIIHALMSQQRTSIWTEEILAQSVEFRLSHQFPSLRIEALAQQTVVPSPLSAVRPLQSSAMYASNFLLGQYLQSRWGGLNTLRALLPQIAIPGCSPASLSDENILCRIRELLESMQETKIVRDRSTVPGLLRHFTVALVLNQPDPQTLGLYSIPGWNGFKTPPLDESQLSLLSGLRLEKGAFLRITPRLFQRSIARWHPRLERYRVLRFTDGTYELRSGPEVSADHLPSKEAQEDTVVLLNTGSAWLSAF